jgi:hypothetical protein
MNQALYAHMNNKRKRKKQQQKKLYLLEQESQPLPSLGVSTSGGN